MIDNSTRFVRYTTIRGDRLDSIAYRNYGDPAAWRPILEANPTLPVLTVYDGGIELRIPVLSVRNDVVTRTALPPWKQ